MGVRHLQSRGGKIFCNRHIFCLMRSEARARRDDNDNTGRMNVLATGKMQPIQPPAELITKDELCRRLRKHPRTIERWQQRHLIPCYRIQNSVMYDWKSVLAAIAQLPAHEKN